MSQQDELDFQQPRWPLYQVVHWIAFKDGEASADPDGDADKKFEEAQVDLLRNWMADGFKGNGRRDAKADHEEIPTAKLGGNPNAALEMFEPLSNEIYNSKRPHGEPMYWDVYFSREDIINVWPKLRIGRAIEPKKSPQQTATNEELEEVGAWLDGPYREANPRATSDMAGKAAREQFPLLILKQKEIFRPLVWNKRDNTKWPRRGNPGES